MINVTHDVTKAQRLLRHSKITTTVDTYNHKVGKADERAAQLLADTVFPTLLLPCKTESQANSELVTNPLPDSPENEAVETHSRISYLTSRHYRWNLLGAD